MGRRTQNHHHYHRGSAKSHTLPSSPTHSSSSSEFEFTISVSPRKPSAALCPADELFYKGQLLPLHLSPRLSMVRTLLLSSASTSSSSDTTTTASRDSTASHSSSDSSTDLLHHHLDCDSSRPSSVADDEYKRLTSGGAAAITTDAVLNSINCYQRSSKPYKYFSLAKFSSVFRKENKNSNPNPPSGAGGAVKRVSSSAKEVIRRYLKKVKPFYDKLSQKNPQPPKAAASASRPPPSRVSRSANTTIRLPKNKDINNQEFPKENTPNISLSFSGNLWYPRRRSCISSCPSSMRSSPSHSKSGYGQTTCRSGCNNSDTSSMEELQSAIQGAITHCKNSLIKNKNLDTIEI